MAAFNMGLAYSFRCLVCDHQDGEHGTGRYSAGKVAKGSHVLCKIQTKNKKQKPGPGMDF